MKIELSEAKPRTSEDFCGEIDPEWFALVVKRTWQGVSYQAFVPVEEDLPASMVGAYIVKALRDHKKFNEFIDNIEEEV
jgi:hypothetical protein